MNDTVNLLVFLYHAKKENCFNLPEQEKNLLLIKQEHLNKAGITLPIFHNTLKLLDKKGYLMGLTVVDDDFHTKAKDFASGDGYNEILAKIPDINAEIFSPEGKNMFAERISDILPPQYHFDMEAFSNEKITVKDLLDQTKDFFKIYSDDVVSYVMLFPFRSIEKLLQQMNIGRSFDDIQDSGIWYDPNKFEFHLGKEIISTSYQGKPNIEHDVLAKLEDNLSDGVVWFDDIDSYKPRPLKDALIKFVHKHEQLKEIFSVYADRLEFNKKAFE